MERAASNGTLRILIPLILSREWNENCEQEKRRLVALPSHPARFPQISTTSTRERCCTHRSRFVRTVSPTHFSFSPRCVIIPRMKRRNSARVPDGHDRGGHTASRPASQPASDPRPVIIQYLRAVGRPHGRWRGRGPERNNQSSMLTARAVTLLAGRSAGRPIGRKPSPPASLIGC